MNCFRERELLRVTELYCPVVLFIMLNKMVLTFEFVDKIPK